MNIKLTDHQKMIVNKLATGEFASIIDMNRQKNRYRFCCKKIITEHALNAKAVDRLINLGLLFISLIERDRKFYKLAINKIQHCASCKHVHFGIANIEISRARCSNSKVKKTFIDNPHQWCDKYGGE